MMAVKQKVHLRNYWTKLLKKYAMRFGYRTRGRWHFVTLLKMKDDTPVKNPFFGQLRIIVSS